MIKDAIRKTYDRYMLRNIRKNNIIDDTVIIREFTSITDSKIGYHSGINSRCEIHGLTMGNYSQIGPRTTVGMRDHIYKNFTIVDDFFSEEEKGFKISVPDFDGYLVKIGNDVWIGGGYYNGKM